VITVGLTIDILFTETWYSIRVRGSLKVDQRANAIVSSDPYPSLLVQSSRLIFPLGPRPSYMLLIISGTNGLYMALTASLLLSPRILFLLGDPPLSTKSLDVMPLRSGRPLTVQIPRPCSFVMQYTYQVSNLCIYPRLCEPTCLFSPFFACGGAVKTRRPNS